MAKKKTSAKKPAGKKAAVKKPAASKKKAVAKKKPATKKKPVTKKKPAAKKKPATRKGAKTAASGTGDPRLSAAQQACFNRITAIFWGEFVRGAGDKLVEDDCYGRAITMGAERNIRRNIVKLCRPGPEFNGAKQCSYLAGKKARDLATVRGSNVITPDIYRDAYNQTFQLMLELRKRGNMGILSCICELC